MPLRWPKSHSRCLHRIGLSAELSLVAQRGGIYRGIAATTNDVERGDAWWCPASPHHAAHLRGNHRREREMRQLNCGALPGRGGSESGSGSCQSMGRSGYLQSPGRSCLSTATRDSCPRGEAVRQVQCMFLGLVEQLSYNYFTLDALPCVASSPRDCLVQPADLHRTSVAANIVLEQELL